MQETEMKSVLRGKIAAIIYFSGLYLVVTGICYLLGYWELFGIDILGYLQLTDIVNITIYPLALVAALFSAALIVTYPFSKRREAERRRKRIIARRKAIEHDKKLKSYSRRKRLILQYIEGRAPAILLILAALAFFFGPIEGAVLSTVPAFLAIFSILGRSKALERVGAGRLLNSQLFSLLLFAPLVTYAYGRMEASNILQGLDFTYIDSKIGGLEVNLSEPDPEKRLRYLGQAGGKLFLLQPDNKTLDIVSQDQAKVLQLKFYTMDAAEVRKRNQNSEFELFKEINFWVTKSFSYSKDHDGDISMNAPDTKK